jgi:hypothetical protein
MEAWLCQQIKFTSWTKFYILMMELRCDAGWLNDKKKWCKLITKYHCRNEHCDLIFGHCSDFLLRICQALRVIHLPFCHCNPPLTESHQIHFFRFWMLPNLGSCTVIAFPPTKRNELLIATVNSSLNLMNIGRLVRDLRFLLQWLWRILSSGMCDHVV